ncbi:BTB/POZ protein [Rhizophagus irregularis DAOM 181602=DAOM 197198]|nr:BTB/POZ protein [Rhizophagus irregularis DAOM 181602=DAOM 197198]
MDDNKLLPKLSQNLLEILKENEYYDITIEVVLRYIYGGKLSLDEYHASDLIKILVTGNVLGLQELITYIQSFLVKTKANWMCIPFIKFHNLTSREFSDKVLPYRKVLPKELLYDDLLKYFMNLDSQPINDSKPLKDSNEILGGYNPVEWESEYDEICEEAYRYTKKSFIFSFNSDNIETYIFSCVKCKRFALLNYNNSGPVFGIGDLGLYGDTGCCDGSAYEKQIRETTDTFAVEEYEVFQIIKEK